MPSRTCLDPRFSSGTSNAGSAVPSQGSVIPGGPSYVQLYTCLLLKMPSASTDVLTAFSFMDGAGGTLVSNGSGLNGVADVILPNTSYTYFYAFGNNTAGTVSFEGADVSGAGTPSTLIAMAV